MTFTDPIWLLFPIAITLHNLEEAIWLPKWSRHASRFHQPVEPGEFHFAVLCVTILAYLSTFLAMAFPTIWIWKQIFFGFLGAMILNTFVPHLFATILLKRYCPGLITGLLLLIPINATIIYRASAKGNIQWLELVISTLLVGIILLAVLPVFFQIGKKIIKIRA
jgi:hypothetical protein